MLSKKKRKELLKNLQAAYPLAPLELVKGADRIEYLVESKKKIILIDGVPAFIILSERLVPHLKFLLKHGAQWLPMIIVDEGAVKPIGRGADLMRPGIVEIKGSFRKGDIIVIIDPRHNLPLAVHEALYDASMILGMEKGRVSQRLHHVGDVYWKMV